MLLLITGGNGEKTMTLMLVAKALYWTWILSEFVILGRTVMRPGGDQVKDRGSLLLLWITLIAAGTLGARYGDTHAANLFPGTEWIRYVGLAIMALGVAVRWTAVLSLGRAFSASVAIRAGQQLYTQGLYRRVRHPSYLGLLMILAAIGVHTHNWTGFAIILIPSFAALSYRIHVEEKALQAAFGNAYEAYSSATKRLIPGVY
jgi:protein-S-isoprenylcysteine O-methyltransferase Ste14